MRDQTGTQEARPESQQKGILGQLLKAARSSLNFLRQLTEQLPKEKTERVIKKVVRAEGIPVQKPKAVIEQQKQVKRVVIRFEPSVPRKKPKRVGDVCKMGFIKKSDRRIDDTIWFEKCLSTVSSSYTPSQLVTPPRASEQSEEESLRIMERIEVKCDPKDPEADKMLQKVAEAFESKQLAEQILVISGETSFSKPICQKQQKKQQTHKSQEMAPHISQKLEKTEKPIQNKLEKTIVIDDQPAEPPAQIFKQIVSIGETRTDDIEQPLKIAQQPEKQQKIERKVSEPVTLPAIQESQKDNPFLPSQSQKTSNPFLLPTQNATICLSDIIKDYKLEQRLITSNNNLSNAGYGEMELQETQMNFQPPCYFTPQKSQQSYDSSILYTPQPQQHFQPMQFSSMSIHQLFGRENKNNSSIFFEQQGQSVRYGRPQKKFEFGKKPKTRIF